MTAESRAVEASLTAGTTASWLALYPRAAGDYESQFSVIEAYYDRAGNVMSWCPATPLGSGDVESLATDLGYMSKPANRPSSTATPLPHSDGSND